MGLSSNSISIYSDGINNLFDSLTGILSFLLLYALMKQTDAVALYRTKKTEQLLTFIISVAVAFSAFYFAYNSLERFTYPTPVAFEVKYLLIILATAAVKLFMFIGLRFYGERSDSSVVKLISVDSLLDFFITAVTALTLILSVSAEFAFDALCGLGISGVIAFSAVKNIISSLSRLTESPSRKKREKLTEILADEKIKELSFSLSDDREEVYIRVTDSGDRQELARIIEKETGIKAYFIVCEE